MPTEGVVTEVLERTLHQYPRFRVALADGALAVPVAGPGVQGGVNIAAGTYVLVELQPFNRDRG